MARSNIARASLLGLVSALSCLSVIGSASASASAFRVSGSGSNGGLASNEVEARGVNSWKAQGFHNVTTDNTTTTSSASVEVVTVVVPFHLQAYVASQRYYSKSKSSFISFSQGGDGTVTQSWEDGAEFWISPDHHLKVGDKFVHLDFSSGYAVFKLESSPPAETAVPKYSHGKDGWLHIQNLDFSFGQDNQAVLCLSDDGFLFVQAQNKPPFACRDVGLAPQKTPGPKPKQPPPAHNTQPSQSQPQPTSLVSIPAWEDWTTSPTSVPATATATATTITVTYPSKPVKTSKATHAYTHPSKPSPSAPESWPTQQPTSTGPSGPDPSSDLDWTEWVEKRSLSSSEFDGEDDVDVEVAE
ncbi:hypothetical protein A1O3_06203 [Capronia epimyces CBS 606.96]|uniref:DUF7908 domain-containing protein n=1 Tax=Capronia epimyces CBS 606.96 TaxID=1182542 RepID=W9XYG6_9EURO|nr:uncharacterized protein A1O3_06203 [Capronia epimyces CBS 606.96]EXJ82390.1 hypothetical protein A1O3_06203 [Capronia epimyces CBS 606.96]